MPYASSQKAQYVCDWCSCSRVMFSADHGPHAANPNTSRSLAVGAVTVTELIGRIRPSDCLPVVARSEGNTDIIAWNCNSGRSGWQIGGVICCTDSRRGRHEAIDCDGRVKRWRGTIGDLNIRRSPGRRIQLPKIC
jgi:hypothetical protein